MLLKVTEQLMTTIAPWPPHSILACRLVILVGLVPLQAVNLASGVHAARVVLRKCCLLAAYDGLDDRACWTEMGQQPP